MLSQISAKWRIPYPDGKKLTACLLRLVMYLMLIGLAFVFLYPYIYLLVTSFKSYEDVMNTVIKWIPQRFSPGNWVTAFKALNFKKTFPNSVLVTLVSTAGHLISCSLAAYGFARFEFKGRSVLFFLVVFSIIVPVQTIICPIYMIWTNVGAIGTYLPLLLPAFLGAGLKGGLYIFIFRQFFLRMPKSLEEAAFIDGCSEYGTFFRIIIPSSWTPFLVCFVLSIVWQWNDSFEPGLYITSAKDYLLPQMLPSMYTMFQELLNATTADTLQLAMTYHEGVAMAGTAICTIPLIIVYFFFQNRFMQGIERSGITE